MEDLEGACVSDDLSGGGHELGVQGIELVRISVGPESQSGCASDDFEGLLESSNHISTAESIILP